MLRFIKNTLGFYPKNVFLYQLAFAHKSSNLTNGNGHHENNERLEYLGDAVLNLSVADFLYKKYPFKDEGFLSEMRSKIVSRQSLNHIAHKMGLSDFIRRDKASKNSFKSIDGNALEALLGAIYLDTNYVFTQSIIIERILLIHLDIAEVERRDWNFKGKLTNLAQKRHKSVSFHVIDIEHAGGSKLYHVEAIINNKVVGNGSDHSIKAAEQQAAEQAFKALTSQNR